VHVVYYKLGSNVLCALGVVVALWYQYLVVCYSLELDQNFECKFLNWTAAMSVCATLVGMLFVIPHFACNMSKTCILLYL
jgi:hypothetical protein